VKQYYWHEWPCCSGTYIQTVADYHNIVCFHDDHGLFVNFYVPFEVRCRGVTLRQETLFPESETVRLRLPVRLRLLPVDRQHSDRVAILCGPVVLAQDEACCRRPFALDDVAQLESQLVRDAVPLYFNVVDTAPERHRRWLQPLYRFPGFWPYWVYFDLKAPPLY
jgi:DUF1680 family protein